MYQRLNKKEENNMPRKFVGDPQEMIRFQIIRATGAFGSDDPNTKQLKEALLEALTGFTDDPTYGLSSNMRDDVYEKFSALLENIQELADCDENVSAKDLLRCEKNVIDAANNLKPGWGERLANIVHEICNKICGSYEKEIAAYKEKEAVAETLSQGIRDAITESHEAEAPRPR